MFTFDVITKIKYCLRVCNDKSFHLSCNECVISPKEIKDIHVNSVLTSCLEVKEILTFLESYANKSQYTANNYIKMASEALNCAVEATLRNATKLVSSQSSLN